jgi:hypothetical protein
MSSRTLFSRYWSPVYRYRRVSDLAQRQQTKLVVFALTVAASGQIVGILATSVGARPVPWALFSEFTSVTAATVALLAIPVSIGVAIVRCRLWEMGIINRTRVSSGSTCSSWAGYRRFCR